LQSLFLATMLHVWKFIYFCILVAKITSWNLILLYIPKVRNLKSCCRAGIYGEPVAGKGILDILGQATAAMTENEIKAMLDKGHDRTTFYRSFRTLIENNLVHRIVVDNLVVKYALNPQSYSRGEHVHFYCTHCDSLLCIEDTNLTGISLPMGFEADETEVIVKGTCKSCKLNKNNDHNE